MKEKTYILFLLAVGIFVYFPGLFNGFVGDDILQIVANTSIHSLANFFHFFTGSTFASGGSNMISGLYYRPLMLSIFAIIYSMFGAAPFPYHFFQLVVHLCNVVFLFFFLRYFFKSIFSFGISLVFMVHPITSEAVLYSANLQDVLFVFFGFLSLLLLQWKNFHYKSAALLFLCYEFSLLAKESGVLFLIVGCLYSLFFQRKKFIQVILSAIFSLSFYLFLRYIVAKMYLAQGSIAPIYKAAFAERFITIPAIILYYFKTLFLPFSLGVDQYWIIRRITFSDFYFPLLCSVAFVAFFLGGWLLLRKKRVKNLFVFYLYFFLWFCIGMLFHMQLIPLDATVADRWFYFPFVGLLGMVGLVIAAIPWKQLFWSKYLLILFWFLGGVFGLITFFRCFDWRSNLSLYGHDITTTRENFILDNAYATALIGNGQFSDAKVYALRSIHTYPYYANMNNMAIIAVSEKEYSLANMYFLQAIRQSRNYMLYENYSSFLLHYGDIHQADIFTQQALQLFPQSDVLHSNLKKIQIRLQ